MTAPLRFQDVEVESERVDVLVDRGRVAAMGRDLDLPSGTETVDGGGGALLPGLHDHHVHLLAMGAAARSVDLTQLDRADIEAALRAADRRLPPGAWIRAIGYHEASHGPLDRWALDETVPGRPVRVQHATGAMWVLNSRGVDAARVEHAPAEQVERDADATVTGRLFAPDDWLSRYVPREPPDLAGVGRELTRFGITGVTDATPYRDPDDLTHLRAAAGDDTVPQRVVVTGAPDLDRGDVHPLVVGPAKVVVPDHDPPDIDALAGEIAVAHDQQLPVAIHCASRLALVLTVAALEETGSRPGDRIEHGAVVPPELFGRLLALGVTIVTQPGFVHARGDRYLEEVEPEDVPHLWRCGSLVEAGIPVGFGSDAPLGPADPWAIIRAAIERRTRSGRELGPGERLAAEQALARFLTPWDAAGGPRRRVEVGAAADLCLLHLPLVAALAEPGADAVRLTIVDGCRTHRDDE